MKKIVSLLIALTLTVIFAVPAFAVQSPVASEVESVNVSHKNGGSVSTSKNGNLLSATAEPEGNNDFAYWVITGDYEIVSGSLNSKDLVIRPLSGDVTMVAYFKDAAGSVIDPPVSAESGESSIAPAESSTSSITSTVSTVSTVPGKKDDSATSPKTGDPAPYVVVAVLVAFAMAACTFKKVLSK